MISCQPIQFVQNKLKLLDQRALPGREIFLECKNEKDVHQAIKDMVVRGAPCIGFAGIYGLALAAKNLGRNYSLVSLKESAKFLKTSRPTAVNLAYELDRAIESVGEVKNSDEAFQTLKDFAQEQMSLSQINNTKMSDYVIADMDERIGKPSYRLLTHCNTGFLACGSIGTALGVVQRLGESGRVENVFVDETRPYLQGARLTSFELDKLGIPSQLVVEGAASYLMKNGLVDAVLVGADRIARNGDTANKIGTSNLSIIASEYKIPFYVVAPLSTFDFSTETGDEIEIELRDENEVLNVVNTRVAPSGARALNPSFDVTDNKFITGIGCEKGLALPPFIETLARLK